MIFSVIHYSVQKYFVSITIIAGLTILVLLFSGWKLFLYVTFKPSSAYRFHSCEEGCITTELTYYYRNVFTEKLYPECQLILVYPREMGMGGVRISGPREEYRRLKYDQNHVFTVCFKDTNLLIPVKEKFSTCRVPSYFICPCSRDAPGLENSEPESQLESKTKEETGSSSSTIARARSLPSVTKMVQSILTSMTTSAACSMTGSQLWLPVLMVRFAGFRPCIMLPAM